MVGVCAGPLIAKEAKFTHLSSRKSLKHFLVCYWVFLCFVVVFVMFSVQYAELIEPIEKRIKAMDDYIKIFLILSPCFDC
jgi:hypothetical protein